MFFRYDDANQRSATGGRQNNGTGQATETYVGPFASLWRVAFRPHL